MNEARLERGTDSAAFGTFGVLYAPGFSCWTIERPWQGNRPYVSCIPAGLYELNETLWRPGVKDLRTYELVGVPGRTLIKLHPANLAEELEGCIAPGMALGVIENQWAVVRSTEAHRRLVESLGRLESPRLRIVDPKYGGDGVP